MTNEKLAEGLARECLHTALQLIYLNMDISADIASAGSSSLRSATGLYKRVRLISSRQDQRAAQRVRNCSLLGPLQLCACEFGSAVPQSSRYIIGPTAALKGHHACKRRGATGPRASW